MTEKSDESISLSLRLIKVKELADNGRFKEAEALLAPDGAPPENSIALHTLAAVVTKAGNYARALALWKTLQQRDPKNLKAREMITAIETWMSRPGWVRFPPAGAAATLVLLVGLGCCWAMRPPANAPATATVAAPAHPTTATTTSTPTTASKYTPSPAPAPTADTPPVRFQLPPPPAKPKK